MNKEQFEHQYNVFNKKFRYLSRKVKQNVLNMYIKSTLKSKDKCIYFWVEKEVKEFEQDWILARILARNRLPSIAKNIKIV